MHYVSFRELQSGHLDWVFSTVELEMPEETWQNLINSDDINLQELGGI